MPSSSAGNSDTFQAMLEKRFMRAEEEGRQLQRKVAYAQAGIPMEDAGARITNSGVSGKVLLGLGGMLIAGLTSVAIAYILSGQPASAPAPPTDQQVELTVEIRDQHGDLMYIPTATPTP